MGLLSPYTHLHGENRSPQSAFYSVHFVKSILCVTNGGGWSRPSDKGWGGGHLQLGAHFKGVSMSQLGGSGGMLVCKILKFKPSEMAGNAFKTNIV